MAERVAPKHGLAMRFTSLFLFAGFLHVSARGYTQEKITLSERNASLEKIFSKIRQQSGFSIWYDETVLERAGKIDIELKNVTLEEALDYCCKNQPLTYSIVGKMVVIKAKEEKKDKDPPPPDLKGKVMNEKGEPLAGATVSVKGTNKVYVTNESGEYILRDVGYKSIIIVSNIGYETISIEAKGANVINFQMHVAVSTLDEKVVIAYGTIS